MQIKKVIILGIDAIEYDLVETWDLHYLKQVEYGKTQLPLLPGQEPITVVLWPCFITGKKPNEMGFSTVHVFPQPLQRLTELFLPYLRSIFIDYTAEDIEKKKMGKQSFINRFFSVLKKMGLVHSPTRNDIIARSIFDEKNISSIHYHIPVYDKDGFPQYRRNVVRAIDEKTYRPILEMECKQEFIKRSEEVFEFLNNGEDVAVFMQYFFVLDAIQHVFFKNERKIAEYYIMFDELIKKINKQITNDTLLLIVSDHGQKKGMHTPYGYYSINKPLQLQNPKLIDFKWIITQLIETSK